MDRYVDLTEFYILQENLDKEIALKHNISYASTRCERTLALFVEISEFANASRCFKYWSNKPSESKERLLDEFADGLHFILSLGVDINIKNKIFRLLDLKLNCSETFLKLYQDISKFSLTYLEEDYINMMETFLSLIFAFNFEMLDLSKAYLKKLNINYKRQENNY